jgi:hypothetical protein
MNANELIKNKEYAYRGSDVIERVVYKYETINGYLFEGLIGSCRTSAVLTESQVNDLITEL